MQRRCSGNFTWFFRWWLAILVIFGTLAPAAFAQGGRGIISGRVTDTGGGVLQGAQITIDPGGAVAASDIQGQFLVNGLAPGSYTVTISYVGFATVTKSVTVTAGQVASADAQLAVESQNQEVLVTAERASGEAEEINRQRTADNVLQVLTSDVIRSLPNANMADALGRLPSVTLERDEGEGKYVQVRGTEPRLTNVTLDGISVPSPENFARQIKLDAIPADIVESVEINKTLQANMDADGIGGSVNLVTKTAGERPTVNVSGMGGYTPIIGGRPLVETTGTVGQRFGSGKRLGMLLGGSYDWNGRGINDMEPSPDAFNNNGVPGAPFYDAADLRNYRYYRTRWGLAGSVDYKLAEGSSLYVHGFYSDFKNYGDRWVYNIQDNTPVFNPGQFPNGIQIFNGNGCSIDNTGVETCGGGTPSFNASIRRPDYAIANLVAGGKHVLSTSWFSWDVSASRSRQLERGDPQANFKTTDAFNNAGSSCQFDPAKTTDQFRPQWGASCFSEISNPANFDLKSVDLLGHGLSAQLNLQITGAGAKRYHLGSHLATIEVGGRFRNAHKFDDSFTTNMVPNVSIPFSMFTNSVTNSDYYGGGYKQGPFADYSKVLDYFNAHQSQFSLGRRGQLGPGYNATNYDLIEKVSAAYVMNTIDLTNRIHLVAGVRFEQTNLDTTTPSFAPDGTVAGCATDKPFFCRLITTNGSYLRVLPSASLRFALDNNTDIRIAYSRGLGRPNPTDIAQAVSFTQPSGATPGTVTFSNPNLKAEAADNVDVLFERTLKPFGMISAGFFYKNLIDPIVSASVKENFPNGPTPNAPPGLYTVSQSINAGSARLTGFEAAYLQHLSFLPGFWGGLGISANYGYTYSTTNGLPGRSDHPRLLRSAPNTWNISPTYDRGRVSIRAGLSYNQANIFAYQFQDGLPGGLHGPLSDNYLYSHLEIDAQGSFRLGHGLSFVMYGLNLNNEVFGFYNGSSQYFNQREYYRPTVAAGFRWSPTFEHK
jgi:TonB-dependent receptor